MKIFVMEKRAAHRITPGLKAEIRSGGLSCEGVIENLSEDGMFVVTSYSGRVIDFKQGTTLVVRFQFYSKETIELKCTAKRSENTPPQGITNRLGLKIFNPPWHMSE